MNESHDGIRPLSLLLSATVLASALLTLAAGAYDPGLASELDAASRAYADLSYPLNINEATKEELAGIEGVTARQAGLIVDFRDKVGVIPDLRMLTAVRGIGPKTFERLERNTFVSFKDEPLKRPAPASPEAAPRGEVPAETAKIPLNAATAEDLTAIRGIGEKTAALIVGERDRMGGFRSFDDLLAVRGVGPKRVDALRERFSLGY